MSYRGFVLIYASRKAAHAGETLADLARSHGLDQSSLVIGPWCWVLANVQRLSAPIPLTGQLGLWRPPATLPPLSFIPLLTTMTLRLDQSESRASGTSEDVVHARGVLSI